MHNLVDILKKDKDSAMSAWLSLKRISTHPFRETHSEYVFVLRNLKIQVITRGWNSKSEQHTFHQIHVKELVLIDYEVVHRGQALQYCLKHSFRDVVVAGMRDT